MTLLMVPLPFGVEHLQRDEIRVGRDAGLLAVRVVAVAGDDAGDVRAVAVVVVRASGRRRRSRRTPRRADCRRDTALERAVVRSSCHAGDARVDHRDADAGAGQAGRLIDGKRADGDRGPIVELGGGPVEMDGEDGGVRGKARQHRVRYIHDVAVDDLERAGGVRLELRRKLRARPQHDDCTGVAWMTSRCGRPEHELVVQPRLWARGHRVRRQAEQSESEDGEVRLGFQRRVDPVPENFIALFGRIKPTSGVMKCRSRCLERLCESVHKVKLLNDRVMISCAIRGRLWDPLFKEMPSWLQRFFRATFWRRSWRLRARACSPSLSG